MRATLCAVWNVVSRWLGLGGLLMGLWPFSAHAAELQVGGVAPAFELHDQRGEPHRLSDYRGHWVILYFYPTSAHHCASSGRSANSPIPQLRRERSAETGTRTPE